ncbi:unannotated protein [freshwater metagenome]|uniref:Unannotated protein n=1 Tax=freshwater metagenome TaxID=449393 RepID=A0A6J7P0I8_9ZZZZ
MAFCPSFVFAESAEIVICGMMSVPLALMVIVARSDGPTT